MTPARKTKFLHLQHFMQQKKTALQFSKNCNATCCFPCFFCIFYKKLHCSFFLLHEMLQVQFLIVAWAGGRAKIQQRGTIHEKRGHPRGQFETKKERKSHEKSVIKAQRETHKTPGSHSRALIRTRNQVPGFTGVLASPSRRKHMVLYNKMRRRLFSDAEIH